MTPATSKTATSLWQAPGHALTIEYSHRLLEDILIQVVDGFESYLSGGCETGGVLFGEHAGGLVRLVARRPLELTPPRPSYILGGEDERRLAQLLEEARRDPELRHLEPVGWYHSHTRSEVFLSEADLDIYDRYFPEPWQVALVARPVYGGPVRAGFFFREPDGYIRSDASYNEFSVDMPERGGRLRQAPPWPEPETEFAAATRAVEEGEDASELPPPPDPDRWWRWALPLVGVLFFLALSAGATWRYWNNLPVPPVGLSVEARAGWLEISWNGDHQALRLANEGLLSIRDGEKQASRRLTPDELRQSRARYQPSGERVEVRLEAPYLWVRTIRESVTWLAHPGWGQPAPETLAARAERDLARAEQETVQGDLDRQLEEIRALETRIQELSAPPKPSPRPFAGVPSPRPTGHVRELPPAPTLSARATPAAPVAAAPQIILPPPAPPSARAPAAPVAAAPQANALPPAARPPTAPAAPPPAVPEPGGAVAAPVVRTVPTRPMASPTRGKFLWTGMLSKGQTLVIEGNRASTGYVSGELPGTAVRLGAFPADLSADGLRVASPNPRYAGAGAVSEPPAAHNGWNATRYVFDTRAMRDVLVIESPAGPGSKRVVVRAGTRKLTAILFEWESVAQ